MNIIPTPKPLLRARRRESELRKNLMFMATPAGNITGSYGKDVKAEMQKEYSEAASHRNEMEKKYLPDKKIQAQKIKSIT